MSEESTIYNVGGDIDTDALLEQFEQEYTESETETDEGEPDAKEEPGARGDGEPDPETDEDPESKEDINDPDVHKRNEAFKRMREENKELARYKAFVEKMAQDNGYEDPNQIFTAYEEQSLAKEAEERGVDLETMKEIDTLRRQTEAKALEEQQAAFQQEREATIEKYNLSDEDVQTIHNYVHENGLFNLGFEQAYKLANFDNLLEGAKNEGRQNYLADKKKRQQSAALNPGTNSISNSDVASDGLSDDEFAKTLAAMGVSLD